MNRVTRRIGWALIPFILVACAAPPVAVPEPPVAVPKPPRSDRIVLLPQADGSPSAVVVRPMGGGEAVLSEPYATATVTTTSVQTSVGTAGDIETRYKSLFDAMPAQRRSYTVYFEIGGDRLTPDSARRLDEILGEVAKLPAPEVQVVGHTDALGTDSVNDEISMQRARIVRLRLIERGIKPERIGATGRGKRELLVPTRDGVAEPRNRRVEIQVR